MTFMRIRLARADDLDAIFELALQAGPGMTTLKPDRRALAARLQIALATIAGSAPRHLQDYLFVLEDMGCGRVVGLSAIKAAVGLDQPFYSFAVGKLVHASREIGVASQFETLSLSNDMTGAAELCSLFLLPEYRNGNNGRLLSKCRLLFLALFAERFPALVMAEMRGFRAEDGVVPFWDGFMRSFFGIDFDTADAMTCAGEKTFIAELMPKYPMYTALLPDAVRAAIGVVHPHTAPARRLLEQEGLAYKGYIDIFDGGPQLQAPVASLRARRALQTIILGRTGRRRGDGAGWMVANPALRHFSVIVSQGGPENGQFSLASDEAGLLGVSPGQLVALLALNPPALVPPAGQTAVCHA